MNNHARKTLVAHFVEVMKQDSRTYSRNAAGTGRGIASYCKSRPVSKFWLKYGLIAMLMLPVGHFIGVTVTEAYLAASEYNDPR